jgi:hypothetical protein
MAIEVFNAPCGGRTAIDMSKVEAVVENADDNGIVSLMTATDCYRVKCYFDNAVAIFRKYKNDYRIGLQGSSCKRRTAKRTIDRRVKPTFRSSYRRRIA